METINRIIFFLIFSALAASAFCQSMLTSATKAEECYKAEQFAQALYIYKNIDAQSGNASNAKRISELEGKLKDADIANAQFQNCILSGNNALKEQSYEFSYICFQGALIIKPESNFPKTKLKDLAQYITDPAVEKEFARLKQSGDDYYANRDLDMAEKMYNDALVIKPGDKEIMDKKIEIETYRNRRTADKQKYDDYIFKADRLFQAGEYEKAQSDYRLALELCPKESYPRTRLNDISTIFYEQSQISESYSQTIAAGDRAYEKGEYEKAKSLYTEALTYKPEEQYPGNQLIAINEIFNKLNAKENEIASVRESIFNAIEAEQYNTAMAHIQTGLQLLPQDSAFTAQRKYLDSILTERKITDANFENFISMADDFYSDKNYEEAARYYDRALSLKPYDSISAAKLADASAKVRDLEEKTAADKARVLEEKPATDKAAAEAAKKVATEKKETGTTPIISNETMGAEYAACIKRGDNNYNRKQYEAARKEYSEALKFVPNAPYPIEKISEIDDILSKNKAEKAEQQQQIAAAYEARNEELKQQANRPPDYNRIISEGKSNFANGNYDKALKNFNSAIESDPNDKIAVSFRDSIYTVIRSNISRTIISSPRLFQSGQKDKIAFNTLSSTERQNCYLEIIMETIETTSPRVYVNFYSSSARKGGFVFKELTANEDHEAIYIKLSDILSWKRDDINAIEILSENGSSTMVSINIISVL